MKLAGRCPCGVLESLAVGDEHLACHWKRRCRRCKAVKGLDKFPHRKGEANPRHVCGTCRRYYRAAWARKHRKDFAAAEKHRRLARESAARQRRKGAPSYEREKQRKRDAYRANPEPKRAYVRAYDATARVLRHTALTAACV